MTKRWLLARAEPAWNLESLLWRRGYLPVAGVDEAGRGALAGPVVAAAVVLRPGNYPYRDSKVLSRTTRSLLADRLRAEALAWGVGYATVEEIDRINVLRATYRAAQRAVEKLGCQVAALVTDYLDIDSGVPCLAVARGEWWSLQIAAASILAKTERDRLMLDYADEYPGYGFETNMGYGSREHRQALGRLGPCRLHRRSFKGVVRGALFPH